MSNRLAAETSPYLLQHAGNPVDWYPWGAAAFERARAEDRPILLSVGYSACHWCHVMERESFEDEETARVMNELFVNVKVDREERPDVDSIYMTAVQALTGHGGWPMTVFLTPDGSPFHGGTYYPPEPRHGLPSFRQLLRAVSDAYRNRRDAVTHNAAGLREALLQSTGLRAPAGPLQTAMLDEAFARLVRSYDAQRGGFGGAPRFPQPMALEYLLRHHVRTGDAQALSMVRQTLREMARGGMYDQVGGGFHRYSVDAEWRVPHFEKMLYDNALLARLYVSAYQATRDPEFRRVALEILDYVRREMTAPEGGFHSAQDADSEGVEGRFYVWTRAAIENVLGVDDGALFCRYYNVSADGNFEGSNILHVTRDTATAAAAAGVPVERLDDVLARGRAALYAARARRTWPALDDKVLTSWNAMMLDAFAAAAQLFGREADLSAAVRNAEFLLRALLREGGLQRTWRNGVASVDAFLEDHALLADALLTLYEATFDARWIDAARQLADTMLARFWDAGVEAFYDAAADGEALIVRPRSVDDNATPSGNSAASAMLLRLAVFTGVARYEAVAVTVLESMAGLAQRAPLGFGRLLAALDFHLAGAQEVAIIGAAADADTRALLAAVRERYRPNTVVALADPAEGDAAAASIPLLAARTTVDGRATAYVCRRFVCRQPVTSADALRAELGD